MDHRLISSAGTWNTCLNSQHLLHCTQPKLHERKFPNSVWIGKSNHGGSKYTRVLERVKNFFSLWVVVCCKRVVGSAVCYGLVRPFRWNIVLCCSSLSSMSLSGWYCTTLAEKKMWAVLTKLMCLSSLMIIARMILGLWRAFAATVGHMLQWHVA